MKKAKGFTLIELMIVVAIIGILAAIAIPNFLRYQLRSTAAERKTNLEAIFKSEEALRQSERQVVAGAVTGQYWQFTTAVPNAGTLGSSKLPWDSTDLAIAQTIDWVVQGSTYAKYNATVAGGAGAGTGGTFGVALGTCATTNIDADPTPVLAADALWQPQLAPNGTASTTPPNAPCIGTPDTTNHTGALVWQTTDPIGQVIQLSADSAF